MKETFDVRGMSCSACSAKVEKTVGKLEGVKSVSVNLLTNSMKVEFDETGISAAEICGAVKDAGYEASSTAQGASKPKREDETGEHVENKGIGLATSIAILVVIMYLSMGHMVGLMPPRILAGSENALSMALTLFLLSLPIMYLNRGYYIRGFSNLFKLSPNMDSLIAIGSSAAIAYGIFALFRISYGMGHMEWSIVEHYRNQLYFESGVMILTLISIGKYLEEKAKRKTTAAISKLMDLAPKTAILYEKGREKIIPVEDVRVGDFLMVKGGAGIPVDGVIIEGKTELDESSITGESMPVFKEEGDRVIAATINTSGVILIKAEKIGEETVFAQIVKLVEEASSSKPPISRLADRISGIFVPVVMGIALLTLVIWKLVGADFEFAMTSAVSVLVISCPCALGLATPVAVMVGIGKGAEHGLMFKSGEALETLHKVDMVLLDKTGTITEGKPKVTDIVGFQTDEDELLRLLLSLEKNSQHPVAKGIVEVCADRDIEPYEVQDFKEIAGKGLQGSVESEEILAGSMKFLEEKGVNIRELGGLVREWAAKGKTPVLCSRNGEIQGAVALADSPKASSRQAIERLKKMGLGVVLLTGDSRETAGYIAEKVGIEDLKAEVLPHEKAEVVKKLKEEGHTVTMVGDGINDAPALSSADVGIAIGDGTDIAIESGDVVLMKNDIFHIAAAINLSKATMRNIKQNLFWAFFYNVLCIPLAAGVFYSGFGLRLSPMIGAAAMSCSSLFVVSNALRLKNLKLNGGQTENTERCDDLKVNVDKNKFKNNAEEKEEENKMLKMTVEGMMCQNCVKHVKKALEAIEGVEAEVSLENKSVQVINRGSAQSAELKKAVEDAGYEVSELIE